MLFIMMVFLCIFDNISNQQDLPGIDYFPPAINSNYLYDTMQTFN